MPRTSETDFRDKISTAGVGRTTSPRSRGPQGRRTKAPAARRHEVAERLWHSSQLLLHGRLPRKPSPSRRGTSIVVGSDVTISTRYLPDRFGPIVTAKHHSHPPHRSTRSICDLFNASIHCRSIITIAKPLRQHARQPLRFDVSGDLQATWPNFAANRPRFFGMHGCGPHHINWRTRHPAGAEAFAGHDASEAATEMATALRHQGSLLRKIVNRLSSSAMAKVTVSQVSRALMHPEPSLICRSWATTWATRLQMSRSSPTMAAPGKRRAKAHGRPRNHPWGSTRFEFDNKAPSAPNAGSACHAYPMVCVRGRFGSETPIRSRLTL